MTIVAIDHVQLAMPAGGEAEARAFYAGLLGLTETPRPPALAQRGGAWFENQHVKIHVGVDPDFRPARKAHPALVIRDLKLLTERLRAAGAPLSTGRFSLLGGGYEPTSAWTTCRIAFESDNPGCRMHCMRTRSWFGQWPSTRRGLPRHCSTRIRFRCSSS
jgi:hypothetical protein